MKSYIFQSHRLTTLLLALFITTLSGCGGGNSETNPSSQKEQDTTPPSRPATSRSSQINQGNQSNFVLNMFNVEISSTYTVVLSDSTGASVTYEDIATSSFIAISINASSLQDGQLSLTYYLTDRSGNESDHINTFLGKDTQGPGSYSISSTISTLDESNHGNFSFSITTTRDNIDLDYVYVIENSSETLFSGQGKISSESTLISDISLAGLPPGNLTLSLYLMDGFKNKGLIQTINLNKTSESAKVNISGAVKFDWVSHKVSGGLDYNAPTSRSALGIEIAAIDSSNNYIATSTTDNSGNYTLTVPANTNVRIRAHAKLVSEGSRSWDFTVTDNTNGNAPYAIQGVIANSGVSDSERNLYASVSGSSRASSPFAILHTIYQTLHAVIGDTNNVTLPPAEIRWSVNNRPASGNTGDGDISTSYYSPSEGNIYILGDKNSDADEYDPHVIAHEWFHYYEDNMSRSDSLGGDHTGGDKLDMRVALGEGMANAVSGIAINDSVYRDSNGSNGMYEFNFDLEDNPDTNKGWYSESSVQSVIYDLFDDNRDNINQIYVAGSLAHEDFDEVSDELSNIHSALTSSSYKNQTSLTSIYSFLSTYKSISNADNLYINNLSESQGINSPDGFGTGETNNGGSTKNLAIYKSITVNGGNTSVCSLNDNGYYNKLGNRQFIKLNIGTAGNYTVSASQSSGLTVSDPDLIIWKSGVLHSKAESVTNNNESLQQYFEIGTYIIEVLEYSNLESTPSEDACFNVSITNG